MSQECESEVPICESEVPICALCLSVFIYYVNIYGIYYMFKKCTSMYLCKHFKNHYMTQLRVFACIYTCI